MGYDARLLGLQSQIQNILDHGSVALTSVGFSFSSHKIHIPGSIVGQL